MSELKLNDLSEEKLEMAVGGRSNPENTEDLMGGFECPAFLETDAKVKEFVERANASTSTISVRNHKGQSCDGKDLNALLAMDRSDHVTVSIYGMWNDPFRSYASSLGF